MNALLKKEIRLLLPSWITALSLAVVPMWLVKNLDNFGGWGFFVLLAWLGTIVLSLESFGREFSPGVFCFFMSQPEERKQLWRAKVTTLAAATISVLCAFYVSLDLRQLAPLHLTQNGSVVDDAMLVNLQTAPALALTAFAGGLWSTLLLRQTVAAMWFVILPPIAIAISMVVLLPENSSLHSYDSLCINVALIIYSVASYLFARWLFFRAQEVGWTGGTISFSTWKYFDAGEKSPRKRKKRGAVAALFAKELQLHSVSLFCAVALLALHVIAICLRPFDKMHPILELASSGFCLLWLMMPLIIGGMAVAEERKLGVMESLLCLPASRRIQFAIKFVMALLFGVLLGGVMPLVLEKIAAALGAPNGIFDGQGDHPLQNNWFIIFVLIGTTALTFVAFFASTLSKNFLHAVGVAVATALGCGLFFAFVVFVVEHNTTLFGITPWHSILPIIIAVPVIAATLFRLAWLNFKTIHEDRRMWWRNIIWISGALIFIMVSSTLIYNRAWEIFEPAELPHGVAKFSLSNPPKLDSEHYNGFLVRLPDGRVWFDSLGFFAENQPTRWKMFWAMLSHPFPKSAGPQQFIGGSNWVSTTAWRIEFWNPVGTTPSKADLVSGYMDTLGVQADGTLWISSESVPKIWTGANMIRFDNETDWRQVLYAQSGFQLLLLKTDGTLWCLDTTNRFNSQNWRANWPTVRGFKPQQVGTNSDWAKIFRMGWRNYARKSDGSTWAVDINSDAKTGKYNLASETNYDRIPPQNFSSKGDDLTSYIGDGGILWICNRRLNESGTQLQGTGFLQVGRETNWVAVAVTWGSMVALKSDGSLWKWNFPENYPAVAAKIPPVRLGIHNDWIAIANTWGGVVSLAADGSLWLWPIENYEQHDNGALDFALLKLPKQPEFLGNIFAKPD
jgi:ABC-type transport system involved in multi-copper enzyme maturation permease subunit